MRNALRAIARALSEGFAVPGTGRRVRLFVERVPPTNATGEAFANEAVSPRDATTAPAASPSTDNPDVIGRHVQALLARCPELRPFHHHAMAPEPNDMDAFLTFCNEVGVLFEPQARGAHLRSALSRLAKSLSNEEAAAHVARMIAVSDLTDGVVERAEVLRDDPIYGAHFKETMQRFDAAYAAEPPYLGLSRHALNLAGDLRGRTLRWFYEHNRDMLQGHHVLHVAPEATLEAWMREQADILGMRYETLDGFGDNTDHTYDLTALPFADGSFDAIICHRVLEHVLDDVAALQEMNRILSDQGWLDLSVPESPHLPASLEWLVQDASHHDHVRQYGADLPDRIAAAGFDVALDKAMLERTLDEHRADGTYPLRHYLCTVNRKVSATIPT